jgi:hypothetical protein
LSDITLQAAVAIPAPLPTGEQDYLIPNPQTPTFGSNTNVSLAQDEQKGTEVIRLEVQANDNIEQGYAGISFEPIDFNLFDSLSIQVKDGQGNNTAYITLVENTGATWSAWTEDSTMLDQWVTLSFSYQDAQSIDLSSIVEVRLAQWNAGSYYLDQLTLLIADNGAVDIVLPTTPAGGSNATVSLVSDSEKAADVLSLEVLANDNVEQAYVSVPFTATDFSEYASLQFDMKDTQGSNTVYLTLVDNAGATWSAWTEQSTSLN